jgi:hypothetical protein
MSPARLLRVSAAAATLAGALALAPAPARAQYGLPPICGGQATGLTDIGGADSPPVVTVSYTRGTGLGYVDDAAIVMVGDQPKVAFTAPTSWSVDNFLLVVTYTPFLQSYQGLVPTPSGQTVVPLPPPGWFSDPRYRLIGRIGLTVRLGNGQPVPNAILEIAPEFPGSSPYTLEADRNGQLVISCFTYRPEISVTAYDAQGTLYQGTIALDGVSSPTVAEATGSVILAPVD